MPTQSSTTVASRLVVAATVAALSLSVAADTRYWADTNGDTASFNAVDSWDPAPTAMSDVEADTLVLNKGVDKIAQVGTGDNVTVATLYVGWGTTNGTDMAESWDKGGRLDVTGGLLTVTNCFRLGGGYSDKSNNVVNVTGGRVVAGKLRTSDCSNDGGKKSETINVSGTGVFEIATDEAQLATYSGGETFVNVLDGGTFTGDQNLDIGRAGKATFTLDGGTVSLSDGKDVNVGRNWWAGSGNGKLEIKAGNWTSGNVYVGQGNGGSATGELVISGGNVSMKSVRVGANNGTGTFRLSNAVVNTTEDSTIAVNSDSKGTMIIDSGKFASAGNQFRIGEKGVGVLTMNGGELTANYALELNGSSESVAEGTTLNLNGGTITVGQVNTKTELTTATINWNGGILSSNGESDNFGGFFPASAYIKVNVLGGGAIYETKSGRESNSEKIDQPLAGVGAFTKRGGGTLSLNGALDLKGGFKVEGGTLNVSNLARTRFIEISVDAGCTLNLNGASVEVASYKVAGQPKAAGTYSEQGGTITVLSTETLTPASATWTNADGDNDVTNPNNWIVFNAAGEELLEAVVPAAGLPITVIYGPNLPSFATFTDVTWVVEDDVCSEGFSRPDVLKTAAVWYDPSDTNTLTVSDGKVTAMANKGIAGADLDLERRATNKDGAALSTEGFNGRQSLFYDGGSGYRSKNSFPGELTADVERTLFAVAKGDNAKMVMLSVAKNASSDEEGRHLLLAHGGDWGRAYKVGMSNNSGGWEGKTVDFAESHSNTAYVFGGRTAKLTEGGADERSVISSVVSATGSARLSSTNIVSMPKGHEGLDYRVYYGAFEIGMSWVDCDSDGYQGEALIFTNALSDAEMDEVNAYLKAKWLDAMQVMPDFDSLVVNAQVDLGGATRTFEKLSGSGSFVDGTVVVTGDLVVTVNPDGTVVAPSFDKLVLGPSARLVVNGAKNLPTGNAIDIISFASLDGAFAAAVGDKNQRVLPRYFEDHVSARRGTGLSVVLR